MAFYWKIKTFKTKEQRDAWIEKNFHKYRIEIIFVNNGYAVDYKDLIKIKM